jgi:hypothetical protein
MGEAFLIGLASYRLWKLAASDYITEGPRDWLLIRLPKWADTLVTCPWCLGSWIAFGVTWVTDAVAGLRMPVLVGLAAAVVVGWLGSWLE